MMSYVIEDALGEAMALCELGEKDQRIAEAEAYYEEAASSGHPLAESWVQARLPIQARLITASQRDEILEDGTPVLQREP